MSPLSRRSRLPGRGHHPGRGDFPGNGAIRSLADRLPHERGLLFLARPASVPRTVRQPWTEALTIAAERGLLRFTQVVDVAETVSGEFPLNQEGPSAS